MMHFKEGLGWKACYDDERNLYTAKTSWRGDYHLYEIDEVIYSQLGEPGTDADELIHSGRHLYYRGDNPIGPPTAMVIDGRYAELCPWAGLPASEKTMPKELTDIAVDLWENEATREQRKPGRMKSKILTIALALLCLAGVAQAKGGLKPRVVILTDIAPGNIEPDDMESMVRLMAYADQIEIEALITTTGWNCDPYPTEWADSLRRVIDAYGQDVRNLMKRSGQKRFLPVSKEQGRQQIGYWPSPGYLRSRVAMGSQHAGIGRIGKDNDTPGSNLIIRLADEADPRPVWVCCWGGGNTLAQAIWRVQQERTPEQLRTFLRKLRVYTITDQDMVWAMRMNRAYSSHQWMRREFADDLLFVWDESAWLSQNELGSKNWQQYARQIQGRGNLGKAYPTYKWGVEGDTPSFLNVLPNGLHDPDCPEQIGWAGCFKRGLCPDSLTTAWTNWQQQQKSISRSYEEYFYPATFNDFAARMAWAERGTGNRNPVVVVNGSKGLKPIELTARPGATITLDALRSSDPDGNQLSFKWWIQKDAGFGADAAIIDALGPKATVTIPATAAYSEIHVVCEVVDDSQPQLTSYRRIIIRSAENKEMT